MTHAVHAVRVDETVRLPTCAAKKETRPRAGFFVPVISLGSQVRMQLDNRISWMDIVAIAGMALTGVMVFFDVKEDVSLNAQKIEDVATTLTEDIERIESESDQDREEILEAVHQIRDESAAGQRRLEDKLDRLIERELEKQ